MDSDRQGRTTTTVPLKLTRTERTLGGLAVLASAAAGGFGFAQSFEAVSQWGADAGFLHSWMLPLTVDLLIPAFGVLACLLIRLGMEYRLLRWAPLAMTAATVYLNVNTGSRLSYQVAHGLTAAVFALVTEVGMHYYRCKSGIESGTRMGRIRLTRWILSPVRTFGMWRRMVLWEITDYQEAIELERRRLLSIADLEERYGKDWKRVAPGRVLVGLKLGLTPRQAEQDLADAPELGQMEAAATVAAPGSDERVTADQFAELRELVNTLAAHVPAPRAAEPAAPVTPDGRVNTERIALDAGAQAWSEQGLASVRSEHRAVPATVAPSMLHAIIARSLSDQGVGPGKLQSATQSLHGPDVEQIDSAERLRRIRQAKVDGLSQRKAARLALCSPSYVRKVWEDDERVAMVPVAA